MQYKSNEYLDYEQVTNLMKTWEKDYPQLFALESIGQTLEGRDIWLATVTDSSAGLANEKPAYWVDGNTHASEVTGCQACLHTLNSLLEGFSGDGEIQKLLRDITFYVVPRISADGAEFFLKTGEYVRSTPIANPDDVFPEKFEEKDLDGDGDVLSMRYPDAKGQFKISKKDPRVMLPRAFDDNGADGTQFYSMIPEGMFKQYDGFTKRFASKYRYDLNRQFPANFRPEGEQRGAGPYPMYLPEAKAIVKAISERPNIFGLQSFHTFSAVILRPYAGKDDLEMPIPDLEAYKAFGKKGEELTDYPCVSVNHEFRYHPKINVGGGFFDWAYEHRGIFSFTNEIWHIAVKAGLDVDRNRMDFYRTLDEDKIIQILNWCDKDLEAGSFFKDWEEFDHPQLGKVEIGGWGTKYTWTNPPNKYLASEIEKNKNFVIACSKAYPMPVISKIQTEAVEAGSNDKKVRVELENHGFLPTYGSQQAKVSGAVRPVRVELKLDEGQELVSGKLFLEIPHLEGHGTGLTWRKSVFTGFTFLNAPDSANELKLDWIIRGSGVVNLTIDFHRAGIVKKAIEL